MDISSLDANKFRETRRIWRWLLLAVFLYSILIVVVYIWTSKTIDAEVFTLARNEALANFNKDQSFRIWATSHGGVYVPVNEKTVPSPYLAHVPERDVITPSGRKLTLLNPAFMLREMMQEYDSLFGVQGRITSLTPLNQENAPDPWERKALLAFQDGEQEMMEITDINGQSYLRLMRPMVMVPGCLDCHIEQDNSLDHAWGAVGVSVPLLKYRKVAQDRRGDLTSILAGVWVLGLVSIGLWSRRSQQLVEERHAHADQIWHQANFDWLTNLPNRNLFHDRVDRTIAIAHRENHRFALIYIDLDRFKDVNDTRGHDVGDRLLKEAADRIVHCVREMDTVARLGGDEFAVVLVDVTDTSSPNRVAVKIIEQIKRPFKIGDADIYLSASIGITLYPSDGVTSQALLKNADTAMYQAKESGRSAFRYYTAMMNAEAHLRMNIEVALRSALTDGEFTLNYQPIIDIKSGEVVSAEALIRWTNPSFQDIGPDTYITVAEHSGLIIPIGEWVLEQALQDIRLWDKAGIKLKQISVNVSSVQFKSPLFHNYIQERLKTDSHVAPRLCLEITESLYLGDDSGITEQMGDLRKQGVTLSIDDFGTGYSSLGYLKRFSVDIVKIDKTFIRDVIQDPEDAGLCEAIIAMAHHLNLQVVAEGIENMEQLHFLQQCNCDKGQGFLFSRPLPADEFLELMTQRQSHREVFADEVNTTALTNT